MPSAFCASLSSVCVRLPGVTPFTSSCTPENLEAGRMSNEETNKCAAANRRHTIEFEGHWFYNIISFGGRALPAPVAELNR